MEESFIGFCAAGGGGEETQPLSGLQLRRLPESNLLRQLRLVYGASPLAQDSLKGSLYFLGTCDQPVCLSLACLCQIASQRVSSVDLSCCSLEELPPQLFYSQDLTHLNLKHNFMSLHKGVPALTRCVCVASEQKQPFLICLLCVVRLTWTYR